MMMYAVPVPVLHYSCGVGACGGVGTWVDHIVGRVRKPPSPSGASRTVMLIRPQVTFTCSIENLPVLSVRVSYNE